MATVSELITRVTDSSSGRPVIASLASPGKALGAASINIDSATNWTTGSVIYLSIYQTQTIGGIVVKDPSTQTDWKGVLAGTTIGSLTLTGGTDRSYTAGAIVEQTATSRYAKDMYDFFTSFANPDGSLKAGPIQTALNLGSGNLNGWNVLGTTISAVTNNGNRSYDLTTLSDTTGTLSPGMRIQTTRTVTAPTQCASLNGTTQYFNRTTVNGMTFTDNYTMMCWVKLNGYGAEQDFIARFSPTGYIFAVNPSGQLQSYSANASANRFVISYQSLPLNKWVHVAATISLATGSFALYIDGVSVPFSTTGTATSITQAGNFSVGSNGSGANLVNGKIQQAAVFSSVLSATTIRSYMSQSLVGNETSLVSAFTLSNSITDLNTTNANNLTANGSALATNADSPFGGQASGTISATLDYGIVAKVTATTITVNVAEGCAIPTTGGVSSVSYSTYKSPYGFPGQRAKWVIETISRVNATQSAPVINTWYNPNTNGVNAPLGEWNLKYMANLLVTGNAAPATGWISLSTSASAESDSDFTARTYSAVAGTTMITGHSKDKNVSLSVATPYYLVLKVDQAATSVSAWGGEGNTRIIAENAHL